ncbi:MAG: tRNA 2-thiocytidine biosynthesis TtcA family protein [Bacteroidota bacterium]|nr:tRNA 2-thiocytidine biosynthesis TtcA family protein [Bacteroidota bacterium]
MLQSEKLFKKICRKMGTTMRDHSLIVEGDHLLVGLSGGKDSMILLEALAERKNAVPFDFRLSAAHVEATGIGYEIDRDRLNSFCENLGIPLHYRTIEPDLLKDPSQTACFICSWHRRKELFSLTKELNCNKLSLGHHRNDAIETLLMNMIYHGSISSLPYSLKMFEGRIQLIRPMMDLDERMLEDYARLNDLVKVEKSCPHEDRTQRENIAQLIKQVENLHGKGPFNIFKSMGKIFEEYLPGQVKPES